MRVTIKNKSLIGKPKIVICKCLTLPIPMLNGEKKVKFLFSHFFVVPQKVLLMLKIPQ